MERQLIIAGKVIDMQVPRSYAARLASLTVALLLGATGAVAASTPAAAGIDCNKAGQTYLTISNVKQPWKLTHWDLHYNGTGKPMKLSFTATSQTRLNASRSVTAGASVSAGKLIAKLDAKVSGSLAKAKSKTKTKSVSVKATLPAGKRLVVFAGYRQVKAKWNYYRCDGKQFRPYGKGTVKSFKPARYFGAQRCDLKVKNSPLAKLAKKRLC